MSITAGKEATHSPAFELKGSSFTLPLIRLLADDMEQVAGELAEKVEQAPEFFRNTPVVIDLQRLAAAGGTVDFALLVGLLRGYGMIPVGVRGGNQAQQEAACAMELAILSDGRQRKGARSAAVAARADSVSPGAAKAAAAAQGTRLVTQPVRSGQRVYAGGGDLIVVNQVSSGAEILADGNIHVYGSLRGRALAGVKGDRDCRIFCQDLRAELVSVAGHYRVSEDLDDSTRGRPVQIYMRGRSLIIDEL